MQPIEITQSIIGTQEVNSVNARQLHKTLEVKKPFSDWIKSQLKSLNLEENLDYLTTSLKSDIANGGYKVIKEYILTLDSAKHIAMASRTQKGKEVRRYFIEAEKALMQIENRHRRTLQKEQNSSSKDEIIQIQKELLDTQKELIKTKDELIKTKDELIFTLKGPAANNQQPKYSSIGEECIGYRKKASKLELEIAFKSYIEQNPGANQSEVLKAFGKTRYDKTSRGILNKGVGELWVYILDGREKRFYPIKKSVNIA